MKKRFILIIFALVLATGLYGCSSKTIPEAKNDNTQVQDKLSVSSYIPDVSKIYTYSLTSSDMKKEIKVSYEKEAETYKRVEQLDNEYKVSETYKAMGDSILFIDYNAENYGSEGVMETIDKGSRVILKSVEEGSSWENKYTVKREINEINYYNVSGKFTHEGYEKIVVMGVEMEAAVISGREEFSDQGNSIVEKLNVRIWMVKDLGPVKYEIERINGENSYSASFELIAADKR